VRLRRRRKPEALAVEWAHVNREVAYAMAAEMATWPEPIDVIRDTCGLPPRLTVLIGRAWHAVLAAIATQEPYQQFLVAHWRPSDHATRGVEKIPPRPASGWTVATRSAIRR
jgi:hypothetical protein